MKMLIILCYCFVLFFQEDEIKSKTVGCYLKLPVFRYLCVCLCPYLEQLLIAGTIEAGL